MYKIDTKYFNQRERGGRVYFLEENGKKREFDRYDMLMNANGDPEDLVWGRESECVKFDKIVEGKNYSAFAGVNLYVARHGDDGHNFSFLTEDGYEIGQFKDNYGTELENNNDLFISVSIASFVAKEPELVKHLPVEMFLKRKTFGEEILTQYQELKLKELKSLPAGQDCNEFVEDIKNNVAEMNKTFNNIERTRATKENFGSLFKRDREV